MTKNIMDVVPLISVIIPTFNENVKFLRASLESVRTQTLTDFECIVIDESTNSEAASVCRRFCSENSRFQYIRPNKRIGLAGSLNLAISQARGKLIARFDSDDVCMPNRLELQAAF